MFTFIFSFIKFRSHLHCFFSSKCYQAAVHRWSSISVLQLIIKLAMYSYVSIRLSEWVEEGEPFGDHLKRKLLSHPVIHLEVNELCEWDRLPLTQRLECIGIMFGVFALRIRTLTFQGIGSVDFWRVACPKLAQLDLARLEFNQAVDDSDSWACLCVTLATIQAKQINISHLPHLANAIQSAHLLKVAMSQNTTIKHWIIAGVEAHHQLEVYYAFVEAFNSSEKCLESIHLNPGNGYSDCRRLLWLCREPDGTANIHINALCDSTIALILGGIGTPISGLTLKSRSLGVLSAVAIRACLVQNASTMTRLQLSQDRLPSGPRTLHHQQHVSSDIPFMSSSSPGIIAQGLRVCTLLQRLHLAADLNPTELYQLAQTFPQLQKLNCLVLMYAGYDYRTLPNLQSAMAHLRDLYLVFVGLETGGAMAIAGSLGTNRSLTKLDLKFNASLTDDGVHCICQALTENVVLERLTIKGCVQVTANAIAKFLPQMNGLKELCLDQYHSSLLDGLRQNYSLTMLLPEAPTAQERRLVTYYLLLNQHGRRILKCTAVPTALWAHLLGRSAKVPDVLFYFLSQNPSIVQR
jgi:hypothetical protein